MVSGKTNSFSIGMATFENGKHYFKTTELILRYVY